MRTLKGFLCLALCLASMWAYAYLIGGVFRFGMGEWFGLPLLVTFTIPFGLAAWPLICWCVPK